MDPAMAIPTRSAASCRNLVGLGRTALAAEMAAFGAEPFRARQLWHWIYHRGATDFAAMTSLSKVFRERLATRYELCRPLVSRTLTSVDGTQPPIHGPRHLPSSRIQRGTCFFLSSLHHLNTKLSLYSRPT